MPPIKISTWLQATWCFTVCSALHHNTSSSWPLNSPWPPSALLLIQCPSSSHVIMLIQQANDIQAFSYKHPSNGLAPVLPWPLGTDKTGRCWETRSVRGDLIISHFHNYLCNDCTLDMLFPTLVNSDRQRLKFNAAVAFSPEEKDDKVLFWYDNKR